jgi:type II secretory pathway pseudopilin PulG
MNRFSFKKGFTLLEALVAISILMVAVVAPITIAQKGLSSATYSKNQMIASYLAQDVIEYIKNKRDEESLKQILASQTVNWNLNGILADCIIEDSSESGCEIDTVSSNSNVRSYTGLVLEKDGNNFYRFDGDVETNFTRQIQIKVDPYGNSDEALITVTIKWGTEDELKVNTLIYNI